MSLDDNPSGPTGARSWHKFDFSLHGSCFLDIDNRARVICNKYFNGYRYKYNIEAHAKMHDGEVIEVHANVSASYLLNKTEQQALYQDEF